MHICTTKGNICHHVDAWEGDRYKKDRDNLRVWQTNNRKAKIQCNLAKD